MKVCGAFSNPSADVLAYLMRFFDPLRHVAMKFRKLRRKIRDDEPRMVSRLVSHIAQQ